MEALGDRLKKVREDRGYSIEQVSRETNIARKYLRALEDEDFSAFPGDTYLIGFLHNYAEHLGLDSNEMVTLYKNMKLQEQPAPIEELLEPPKSRVVPVLIIVFVLILLFGGVLVYKFFLLPGGESGAVKSETVRQQKQTPASKEAVTYEVKEEIVEKHFKEGDTIAVPVGDKRIILRIRTVGDTVVLSYPSGTADLKLGISQPVDLDNDGKGDIYITVNDIDAKVKGAVIRFDRFINDKNFQIASKETASSEQSGSDIPVNLGSTNASSREKPVKIILSRTAQEPFVLDILFRGYCFVRYIADRGDREEQYFNKGETLRLDINREIQIWLSNAGALTARLGGKDVSFGKPGEVTASLVRWKKNNENGQFDLQLIPVY